MSKDGDYDKFKLLTRFVGAIITGLLFWTKDLPAADVGLS
jgi:hypothetical protein